MFVVAVVVGVAFECIVVDFVVVSGRAGSVVTVDLLSFVLVHYEDPLPRIEGKKPYVHIALVVDLVG